MESKLFKGKNGRAALLVWMAILQAGASTPAAIREETGLTKGQVASGLKNIRETAKVEPTLRAPLVNLGLL